MCRSHRRCLFTHAACAEDVPVNQRQGQRSCHLNQQHVTAPPRRIPRQECVSVTWKPAPGVCCKTDPWRCEKSHAPRGSASSWFPPTAVAGCGLHDVLACELRRSLASWSSAAWSQFIRHQARIRVTHSGATLGCQCWIKMARLAGLSIQAGNNFDACHHVTHPAILRLHALQRCFIARFLILRMRKCSRSTCCCSRITTPTN